MKKQTRLLNNNNVWSANRRYKVNAVVSHAGSDWQNATGINTEPGTDENWIMGGSGMAQNLSQTLAIDNKTNDIPIVSNNGEAVVDVNDDYTSVRYGSQSFAMTDTVVQLYSEVPVYFEPTVSTDFNTPVLNYNGAEVATQPYADAKVANDLTASTTVAPSKTAVNTALALKQNIPFEIQVTQASTSAPTIVSGSEKGLRGATITTSRITDGHYQLVSDLPIFANAKDFYKNTSSVNLNIIGDFLTSVYNGYQYWVSDDYTINVYSVVDFFAPTLIDDILSEPTLIKIEFKN